MTWTTYESPLTEDDRRPDWIDQERLQIENEIRTMKQNGKWDYKLGTAIHGRSYWEGTPTEGRVVYVAPQKTFTIQELSDKVQELEAKLTDLQKENEVLKNKPSNPIKNKRNK